MPSDRKGACYVGVDIGGTFTDIAVMDDAGGLVTTKSLTTPGKLEQGVFDALQLVADGRGMASASSSSRSRASATGRPRRPTP